MNPKKVAHNVIKVFSLKATLFKKDSLKKSYPVMFDIKLRVIFFMGVLKNIF